jgi:D-aspartate ligase
MDKPTTNATLLKPKHFIHATQNLEGQAGAVVLGFDSTGPLSLGIVRSLGRHGIPVTIVGPKHSMASFSRYACRNLQWPMTNEEQQIAWLIELATEHGFIGSTLFPTGDEAVILIACHHTTLAEYFRLTTPPWKITQWAYDKRRTYHLAANLGIDYPWTRYPASQQELSKLDCSFPIILKPAFKTGSNSFTYAKAWRIENEQELFARYYEACALVNPDVIMVQELIPGDGKSQFSFAALCKTGDVLACAVARRTRQYPIDFGRNSTYVETINQPRIEESARRLLREIGFSGLAELEFKYDCRDGRYKLLDFNARTWAWHTLAGRAGVDFPYLLWRMAQDETVPELRAKTGVRWVRMVTDLLAVVQHIRQGHLSPAAYVRSLRGPLEFANFSIDDPLPALVELPQLAYQLWKRSS